jgi:hypothetical protein
MVSLCAAPPPCTHFVVACCRVLGVCLQVKEAFALSATPKQVACACSQGVVRLFASKSLQFRANLPYWSAEGAWPGSKPCLSAHHSSFVGSRSVPITCHT